MSPQAFSIIAAILGWGGAAILLIALFGDSILQRVRRLRGTASQRCSKCWYDLSHAPRHEAPVARPSRPCESSEGVTDTHGRDARATGPVITCSECGHRIKRERQLYKGRTLWKLATGAIVMLLASYAANVTPGVQQRGWVAAVPTTALILGLPWIEPSKEITRWSQLPTSPETISDILFVELLSYRARSSAMRPAPRTLWRWQEYLLVERCFRGDSRREVLDDEWMRFYGRILDKMAGRGDPPLRSFRVWTYGGGTPPWWLARAEALVDVQVRTRAHWPVGEPIYARLNLRRWNVYSTHRVSLVPQTPGLAEAEVYVHGQGSMVNYGGGWRDQQSQLGVPDVDTDALTYEVLIERIQGGWGTETKRTPLRKYDLHIPILIEGTIDDVVQPVEGMECDEAILNIIEPRLHLVRTIRGKQPRLRIFGYGEPSQHIENLTIALHVEVLRDGELLGTARSWSAARGSGLVPESRLFMQPSGQLNVEWIGSQPESFDNESTWSLRLRSDPSMALRNFACDRYWNTEVEVPLRILDP